MIRLMERRDIPACIDLASSGFGSLFGSLAHVDFNEMFGAAAWRPTFYVMDLGSKIVGMGSYNISWLGYGIYSLTWLVVHTDFRRQGIASALVDRRLQDLETTARLILAETPSEIVASLYERRGFHRLMAIPIERNRDAVGREILLGRTSTGAVPGQNLRT